MAVSVEAPLTRHTLEGRSVRAAHLAVEAAFRRVKIQRRALRVLRVHAELLKHNRGVYNVG